MNNTQLKKEAEERYPYTNGKSDINCPFDEIQSEKRDVWIAARKYSASSSTPAKGEGEKGKPRILKIEDNIAELFPESDIESKRWSIFDQRKGAQILWNEIQKNPKKYLGKGEHEREIEPTDRENASDYFDERYPNGLRSGPMNATMPDGKYAYIVGWTAHARLIKSSLALRTEAASPKE